MQLDVRRSSKGWTYLVGIAAAAVVVLLFASRFLWTGTLHTDALGHTLNDQTGYVTAARNIAEHSRYESNVFYPGKLLYYRSHNMPYMPGNYYIRATFYRIFGYSVFTSILPNLVAFVLSALLLHLIGTELFDRESSLLAVAAFLLFPPLVLYSFTAMMELVFVFACLLGVYAFIKLPPSRRHIFGVFVVVPAYLIRETAAFMLAGMAAWMFITAEKGRFRNIVVFSALAVALFLALNQIPQVADRPPTLYARLINATELHYFDAYALPKIRMDLPATLKLIWQHLLTNIQVFIYFLLPGASWLGGFGYFIGALSMLAICAVLCFSAKAQTRGFLLFLVVTSLALLAAIFLLYDYYSFNGIRLFLFLVPLYMAAIAARILSAKIFMERPVKAAVLCIVLIVMAGNLYLSLESYNKDFVATDQYDDKCAAFLDSIGASRARFMVAPYEISLDYVARHYPIQWSFTPSNEESLRLIVSRFPVDLIVLTAGHSLSVDGNTGQLKTTLLDGTFVLHKAEIVGGLPRLAFKPRGAVN